MGPRPFTCGRWGLWCLPLPLSVSVSNLDRTLQNAIEGNQEKVLSVVWMDAILGPRPEGGGPCGQDALFLSFCVRGHSTPRLVRWTRISNIPRTGESPSCVERAVLKYSSHSMGLLLERNGVHCGWSPEVDLVYGCPHGVLTPTPCQVRSSHVTQSCHKGL